MQNCLVLGGSLTLARSNVVPWTITDTAFEGTTFSISDLYGPSVEFERNAFLTYAGGLPAQGGNVIVGDFNWQTGLLGNYYLPPGSPLINAGATTAAQAGLYEFTTQTNQVPEGNSQVDIGYHYVALDGNGDPIDSDNDGTPDYITDATNGLPETWQLQYFGRTGVPGSDDPAGDGLSNLQKCLLGGNPTNAVNWTGATITFDVFTPQSH